MFVQPAAVPGLVSLCVNDLGRSDKRDFTGAVGVWSIRPAPASRSRWLEARGQGSPQEAVKVKGLSPSEGPWSHHSEPTVDT